MSEENESSFDDAPIITYSNRIQKHLFKLTEFMGNVNMRDTQNKRVAANQLILIIQNLPIEAKEALKNVSAKCREDIQNVASLEMFILYGQAHDWIYKNILQDAFKAKPLYKKKAHLSVT